MKFTRDGLEARFAELETQLGAMDEELAPLQKEQATIANYKRDREVELNGILKEKNAARAEIQNEMGMISRALGGRVMSEGVAEEPTE